MSWEKTTEICQLVNLPTSRGSVGVGTQKQRLIQIAKLKESESKKQREPFGNLNMHLCLRIREIALSY